MGLSPAAFNGGRKMSEKPILFNTQMVQAILSGQKTQTRRPIRPRYKADEGSFRINTRVATGERNVELINEDEEPFEDARFVRPPYQVGDILYVRETWAPMYPNNESKEIVGYLYRADRDIYGEEYQKAYDATYPNGKDWTWEGRWRPSLHMPKKAARIRLRVTGIGVEHLQDMTVDDVLHEGVSIVRGFADWIPLWDSTIPAGKAGKAYAWEANPWVWVIYFEIIQGGKISEGI